MTAVSRRICVGRRQHMRKHEIGARVLDPHRVGLGILIGRQQQIPFRARQPLEVDRVVERADPDRQRVGVVAARRESAVGEPIDVAARPSDGEDRAAILARHGEHAHFGITHAKPIVERRADEPARRCADRVSIRSAATARPARRGCSR